jgi:hypothetical protein
LKQRSLALFLCALVALSACGITYAQWNDVVEIHGEMEFGTLTLRYVPPLDCWDSDDATIDTGVCLCEYVDPDLAAGGFRNLTVSFSNAYPGYEAHCAFTIKNVGSLPDHIGGIEVTPGAGLVLGETYVDVGGNPIGWRLDDPGTGEPRLTIHVTAEAGSLVCRTIDPGAQVSGLLTVLMEDGVEMCHTYGFEVEIIYE